MTESDFHSKGLLSGSYRAALSSGYALRLPKPWRGAFAKEAVICWAGTHWNLFPAAAWPTWLVTLNSLYDPLPPALKTELATAQRVQLKAGALVMPPSLQAVPPGPVQLVAAESFMIEVLPERIDVSDQR